MRWCLRGRITCQSCRRVTQRGSPKYVCDHLWIWLVNVPKMVRQKTKHSQGYSCSSASAGGGGGTGGRGCHGGRATTSLAPAPRPWAAPWPPSTLPHGLRQVQTPLWASGFSSAQWADRAGSTRNSYGCGLRSQAELGSGPCSDISWLHELGPAILPL